MSHHADHHPIKDVNEYFNFCEFVITLPYYDTDLIAVRQWVKTELGLTKFNFDKCDVYGWKYYDNGINVFHFRYEEDAMAFKLRWL